MFLRALKDSPHLRSLVREIWLERVSAEATEDVLRNLHLVPRLAVLCGLVWPVDPLLVPPPADVRPKLKSLTIDVDGGPAGDSSLARWFDLSALRSFAAHAADDPFRNVSFFADLPPTVSEISLDFYDGEVNDRVLQGLAGREALTSLSLLIDPWSDLAQSWAAIPLRLLPNLTRLVLNNVVDPRSLFAVGHQALEHLDILLAFDAEFFDHDPYEGGVPEAHPLHAFVNDLCQLKKQVPSAFPSLRSVRPGVEGYWFSFRSAEDRALPGVYPVARKLRDAGLAFLDHEDGAWQDEWFNVS